MGCCCSTEEKYQGHTAAKVPAPAKGRHVDEHVLVTDVAPPQETEAEFKESAGEYKMGGPTEEGEAIGCFKGGLLYRIVGEDKWSYYNDTQQYEMHVKVTFGPNSELTPMGNTKYEQTPDGSHVLSLAIYPAETQPFFEGKPNGYKIGMSAKPLSDEYKKKNLDSASAKITADCEAIAAATESTNAGERLEVCLANDLQYVDMDYMPGNEALSRPHDKRKLAPSAWQRPRDYLGEELHETIKMFNNIEPNDIDQGQLGDCWLLCAIAALAEFPERVEKLFAHPISEEQADKENHVGAFRVTLNKHGWWTNHILDSYLPVIGGKPCFAKNVEDPAELWASMLEKAYAKVHGSFACITGGDALQALTDLTGFPVNRFDTEWTDAQKDEGKSDELFSQLVGYDESDYVINLNTPGKDNAAYMGGGGAAANDKAFTERYAAAGLGMGHAYSALAVKHFPEENLRLVKIRNPWGNGTEWTGRWSDDSPLWEENPKIAAECEQSDGDDGTFWMEWNDVKSFFDGGGVCCTRFTWFDYRVRGTFSGVAASVCLEITVTQPTQMYCILSQNDKRGRDTSDPDSKYSAILLSIARTEDGRQAVHLNSGADCDTPTPKYAFAFNRDQAMLYTFEPEFSPYMIVPRIYKAAAHTKEFTLGLISETKVGEGYTANFKDLGADCKVFKNYPKFTYESENTATATAEFQHAPSRGAPITKMGEALEF